MLEIRDTPPLYHVTRRPGKDQSRPDVLIYIVDCRVLISASWSFRCAPEVENLRQGTRGAAEKKALLPFAMNPPLSEPALTQTQRCEAPERMKKRAEGCHYQ